MNSSSSRRISEAWKISALRPVTLLSEGLCPYHNLPLIDTYCSLCDCKWEVHSFMTTYGPWWTITSTRGSDKQYLTGDFNLLVPPPFPG